MIRETRFKQKFKDAGLASLHIYNRDRSFLSDNGYRHYNCMFDKTTKIGNHSGMLVVDNYFNLISLVKVPRKSCVASPIFERNLSTLWLLAPTKNFIVLRNNLISIDFYWCGCNTVTLKTKGSHLMKLPWISYHEIHPFDFVKNLENMKGKFIWLINRDYYELDDSQSQ